MKEQIMEKFEKENAKEKATKEKATKEKTILRGFYYCMLGMSIV